MRVKRSKCTTISRSKYPRSRVRFMNGRSKGAVRAIRGSIINAETTTATQGTVSLGRQSFFCEGDKPKSMVQASDSTTGKHLHFREKGLILSVVVKRFTL